MTAVGQLWGRVADRVRSAARGGSAPAIAALDIGTEFAKALEKCRAIMPNFKGGGGK